MNKRRSFLQQLGLLSAGFVVAPVLTSCSSGDQKTEETTTTDETNASGATNANTGISAVGIQLYTLREQLPNNVKGVIPKVAQAGYQDVETYGFSKENGFWGLEPKAFKELLDANGLVTSSGHYEFGQYIATGNEDIVKTIVEAGNIIGQQYITVPYLGEELRNSADDYKMIAQRVNRAAELCNEANLKLAYHNHDFEFNKFGDTTGYDILLNETDPALVGFEADLFWFARAGQDPIAYFKEYPGRFVMWHVKDRDKNSPTISTEIGNGSIDYKEIFKNTELAGVKRIFVEQEEFAPSTDPFESIAQSYGYVKNTLL